MSTLKTTNIQNASSATTNIALDTSGNVTVGNNVTVGGGITASSGTVVMSSPYTMRNKIINGAMYIDQRNAGASVTAGSGYTLDRWNVDRVWAGSTVTIQQSSTVPAGFANSMVATVSTGAAVAAGSYFSIQQYIEGYNVVDMDFGKATAQQFTVSFWVRSSVTGTYGVGFRNSAFDLSYWTTYTVNAANTWEQKSVTITAPTSGTWYTNNSYGLNIIFSLGCGSTYKAASNNAWNAGNKLGAIGQTDLIATTGATFYITGVQLERGTVATPFEYRNYQQELAMCQRYYIRYNTPAGGGNLASSNVLGRTATRCDMIIAFPVFMRAAPTVIETTGLATDYVVIIGSSSFASTAIPAYNGSTINNIELVLTFASGITVGSAGKLVSGANASYLGFSAEL